MTGIITGDIINSRATSPEVWMSKLKHTLRKNKIAKKNWEIYRGDMFQIEVDVMKIVALAIQIKATVKEEKEIDVRMAIGLGSKSHSAKTIIESTGTAFIHSGEAFEQLKNKTLKIKTPWEEFNTRWNMILGLALLTMDNWAPVTAEIFKTAIQNPSKSQRELAKMMKKSQSTISAGMTRAGYNEIIEMTSQFNQELEIEIELD